MNDLKSNLNKVRARIAAACKTQGKCINSVTLLAVSKRHDAASIRTLFNAGQRQFGENYVQEALIKQNELSDLDIEWHFIGPLQSNKTMEVAQHFDWVQSVDRVKLLQRLSRQRPVDLPPLNITLQVNIDNEPQKSGASPGEIAALARMATELPGIRLRGLMAIPMVSTDSMPGPSSFDRMAELFRDLNSKGLELDTLSLGMSSDLEAAIAAGSTMVRIGTDLFGPRPD
jgi:pyridoxal phosphate enzyme (YggS family)